MRRNPWFAATLLLLLAVVALSWASPALPVLAGFTDTPTPSPTPTPTLTPAPSLITTTPLPGPDSDLRVVKQADRTQVAPGETFVYTIVVENVGTEAVTGVVLVDSIPPELELLSATVTQGDVLIEGNRVTANVGVLGVGYSATLTISVRVAMDVAPGIAIDNVAVASSDQVPNLQTGVSVTVLGVLPEAGGQPMSMGWLIYVVLFVGFSGYIVVTLLRQKPKALATGADEAITE